VGFTGWVVGLLCTGVVVALLDRARARHRVTALGPADRVTLLRAALGCGLAALVADGFSSPPPMPLLVGLAAVTLLLDAVDGPVARRTGTASGFGAALDMEVDAFVLLVLSVEVARSVGPWVLLVGAARYLLLAATRMWPWLRRPVPVRYWAKVVAAAQGVALTVAAAQVLPAAVTDLALVAAIALLAESFAHQVRWLRRHRDLEVVVP
jgi:phosphatidylglycerophosphate synthase